MTPAVLKIYGDIGESDPVFEAYMGVPDGMVGAKQVSDFLEANAEATNITVRINSRGGDVQEGWAIYDLLVASGKTIKTIGEGKVYSIATIIFLAGTEREMMKNADGLIHNPFIPEYTLAGSYESSDLLKIAEWLAQEEEKILDFYAQKTGTDKALLATYMKEETKLSAEDMLKLGFATKINEPVKAYAVYKPKIVNMNPQEEQKFFDKVSAAVEKTIKALGLSRLPVKNQDLTDKDGNVLTLEKEAGEPAVGDVATPDGTFTMENGDVIVVAGGVITEVTKSSEAPEVEIELAAAQAEIKRLTEELAAANTAKAEAVAAKASYEAEQIKAAALVSELEGLKNSWKPEARNQGKGQAKLGIVNDINLDRVAEIRNLNKK